MFKIFHRLFDSWRVKDETPKIVHIGRNAIGVIEFYPSIDNPFIEGYGWVRVYDNGEIFCDENMAKLISYTDTHKEFMEFCFDLWKKKTNQKIYPNCIILGNSEHNLFETRQYRDYDPLNYLVQ
jgi:hypothetical protein